LLGAQLGFVGVLHTWGRQLQWHPHIHYLVPGGGLRPDGKMWRRCRLLTTSTGSAAAPSPSPGQ